MINIQQQQKRENAFWRDTFSLLHIFDIDL